MSENSYKPIACSVYDQYEAWALRKVEMAITLTDGAQFQGCIKTLESRSGMEYMVMESGDRFRLDAIERITPA